MKLKMLSICMLFFAFFGCKETEEEADVLQFSQKVVTFSDAAETQTVLISGTPEWKVSCEGVDWCFVDPATDNQSGMFSVMVTQNEGLTARTAVIRVTAGNCIEEIDVVQQGNKTSLELSNSALKVFDMNERCVVAVYADKPWTTKVEGSWMRVEPASGTGGGLVRILFSKNTSASDRSGIVTFMTGDDSRTFELTQEAVTFDDRLHDSLALVAVYNSLNGPLWDYSGRYWLTAEPIDNWGGVSVEGGRVVSLTVSPTYVIPKPGQPDNNVPSLPIPAEIKYLTKMRACGFPKCWLTGTFPREFARCVELVTLTLSARVWGGDVTPGEMTGTIPLELGCLPNFAVLSISGHKISGPFPPELCYGYVLSQLDASHNLLSGIIPPMCYMTSLRLAGNAEMTGTVPEAICEKWRSGDANLDISGTKITPCTK